MVSQNPPYQRALNALSHPITITAILLLLINDHVLRRFWPSWWTGKIGDAAWLAFFPLIMTVILSLLVPVMLKNHERMVAILAFGITAGVFILGKTTLLGHALIVGFLELLLGSSIGLRLDPTDLATLPALLISWQVWRSSGERPSRRYALVILSLGALATIANTPPFPVGVECLRINDDGTITALQPYEGTTYTTENGGFTWQQSRYEVREDYESECETEAWGEAWTFSDPTRQGTIYRFNPDGSIEESTDGGERWELQFDTHIPSALDAYYVNAVGVATTNVPLDAAVDLETGNLILAMGAQGVIVRTPDDAWQWIEVNGYRREQLDTVDEISALLVGEIIVAVLLAVLSFGLVYLIVNPNSGIHLLTVIAIAGGLLTLFTLRAPAYRTFDVGLYVSFVLPIVALASIISGIVSWNKLNARYDIPTRVWLTPLIVPILFLLPFVLWATEIVPSYSLAVVIALALTVLTIGAAGRTLHNLMPIEDQAL